MLLECENVLTKFNKRTKCEQCYGKNYTQQMPMILLQHMLSLTVHFCASEQIVRHNYL